MHLFLVIHHQFAKSAASIASFIEVAFVGIEHFVGEQPEPISGTNNNTHEMHTQKAIYT